MKIRRAAVSLGSVALCLSLMGVGCAFSSNPAPSNVAPTVVSRKERGTSNENNVTSNQNDVSSQPQTDVNTAASLPTLRGPTGIYVNVLVTREITSAQSGGKNVDQSITSYYSNLLDNPAASGLFLQVHWSTLNPSEGVYDWSAINDAFTAADSWNAAHPTLPPKTITLSVDPGFFTPSWVFSQMTSCDGLFASPPQQVSSSCGYATFLDSEGLPNGVLAKLPMPWNQTYKSDWQTFLQALNTQYGSNPDFVSIDVAGPTSASSEMILPNAGNDPTHWQQWIKLLQNNYTDSSYYNSDKAFVEEWQNAIDVFGQTFHGITLVATTGGGLPNFPNGNQPVSNPLPGFAALCNGRTSMDCLAEGSILAYFSQASVGGNNRKAVQESGVKAPKGPDAHVAGQGIKSLSGNTTFSPRILGGLQFNTGVSRDPEGMGDSSVPEQALYNVLGAYFAGTPVGSSYGVSTGNTPLNYLQIYDIDWEYAAANASKPVSVKESGGTVSVTVQDLLNQASQQLLKIAQPIVGATGGQ